MLDFGALPPEVNSTRMYTGPGSEPMMAAAAAWNNLAAELSTTATSCQSVITQLTGDEWVGPSSAAMAASAEPYVAWMHTTAAQLQEAASQAMASAAAYEAAFAMTVPPPVIAANRAQLAALVATNLLGQNTPAIMATEAQYGEMWAQDAAAMYGYAGSSASAGKLSPLSAPTLTANPGGQAAAVSQATTATATTPTGFAGLVSTLPSAMQSLASPLAAATPAQGLADPLASLFSDSVFTNTGEGIFDTASWNMFSSITNGAIVQHMMAPAAAGAGVGGLDGGGALAGAAAPAVPAAAPASVAGAPVLAGMGSSSSVGQLSVPASWSAAAPAQTGTSVLAGSGWTAGAEDGPQETTLSAGMPAVASAGRGGYAAGPRYGVTPKVMPTRVLV